MLKKSYCFLLLIVFLFLTISAVSANDENSTVLITSNSSVTNTTSLNVETNSTQANLTSSLVAKDISSSYGKKVKFSVKVYDSNKKPLKNKLVVFKVANNSYKSFSDSKGIASIDLNLNAGTYKISYSCDGITGKNTYKVKNAYKITLYKWKSGANVKKNKKIKANIPNSQAVKKIIKLSCKGTVMIKFKGGNGKRVFITSGVHGNEISSQIAAMKLIKKLENTPINGTVYIIPFINPKATAKNVRNVGVNLNQKANVKGTISYKTVNLIVKFKCDAYGDFHCTKPGGKPGKDVAMGSYKPTFKSALIAKFISKDNKVYKIIYKKAGAEYPGALEDIVNLKGIPAVTCEVITPHGKIAKGSVSKSLLMMESLLKFNALI